MYGALWRAIPGGWPVRLLVFAVLMAAVLYALITWVFPWADANLLPDPDVTVGMGAGAGPLDPLA